jgi:hypothetical protein
MKKNVWIRDVYVNQVRFEGALQLGHLMSRFEQKFDVARHQSFPKTKPIYWYSIIVIHVRKIAVTMRRNQGKLVAAPPQHREGLGGEDLDASDVGPKQFGPE